MKVSLKEYTAILIISTVAVLSVISPANATVIPAEAGIHNGSEQYHLDSRLRGNDEKGIDSVSIDLGFTKIDLAIKSIDLHLRAWHSSESVYAEEDHIKAAEQVGSNHKLNNDTHGVGITFENSVSIGTYQHSYANIGKAQGDLSGPLDGYAIYAAKHWPLTSYKNVSANLSLAAVYGYTDAKVAYKTYEMAEPKTEHTRSPGLRIGHINVMPSLQIAIKTSDRVTTNITLAPGMKSEASLAAMLSASIEI